MKRFLLLIIVFCIGLLSIQAENTLKYNKLTKKNSGGVPYSKFNINNISTYIYADGDADIKPDGNSGFFFPKGSNKTIVYESGLVWGAKINGQIRVGGSTYNSGLQPGKILPNGAAENPGASEARVFRVRPDYKTGDLSSEVNDGEGTEEEVREQYEKDWNEWPANDGAPFDDKNNDGIYEPGIDIPGVPGADQTLWFVANDLDSNLTKSLYGSLPMGIELQVTIWGYADRYPFSNMIFKKYRLINKSKTDFHEMYISIWSDPDIGEASDDFVGCDTLLDLMYAYNAQKFDEQYDFTPPSAGYSLLIGPTVKDTIEGKSNYKNLKISSHYFFIGGAAVFDDPDLRNYKFGTLVFYNLFQGLISRTGTPFFDPITRKETKFALAGNPITKIGWIDGILHSPGDRRHGMASGPFNMTVGDTQEVVFAQIAARGSDNLNSLQTLRYYASKIPKDIDSIETIKKIPTPSVPQSRFSIKEFGSYNNITLSLDLNAEMIDFNKDGYSFQGMVLSQYPIYEEFLQNFAPVNISTFDKADGITEIQDQIIDTKTGKPVNSTIFVGLDNGFRSRLKITKDFITNSNLVKGKKYIYLLKAYYYNPNADPGLKVIESTRFKRSIVFQDSVAGPTYGDTVQVQQLSGSDFVKIIAYVSNPAKLTGHNYEISFNPGKKASTWNLRDLTTNETVLRNQLILSTVRSRKIYILSFGEEGDGVKIVPFQKDLGFAKDRDCIVEVKYAGISNEKVESGNTFMGESVWYFNNHGYSLATSSYGFDSLTIDPQYYGSSDYELRFTDAPNFAVDYFNNNKVISVPFELWDIGVDTPDNPSDDIRMIPLVKMRKDTNKWGINYLNYNNIYFSDKIYWMKPDVNAGGYDAFANICRAVGIGNPYDKSMDTSPQGFYADFQGGFNYVIGNLVFEASDSIGTNIPAGTVIRFYNYRQVTSDNVFQFKTETVKAKITPNKLEVFQNYPNPFNPSTTIRFFLPEDGNVKLTIYNILGQRVTELLNKKMLAGKYEIPFNGSNLASGIYLYTLKTDNKVEVRKMVLLK